MNLDTPLENAIRRRDWELAALYALITVAAALREAPDASLEDLIDALTITEDPRDEPQS